MRILLIDQLLGQGIQVGLTQEAYTVDWVHDGADADRALQHEHFDLVILDLSLPELSGMKVLQQLRSRNDATPVLILTARETMEDRILGLDAGADDYMSKPFELEELFARLRALLRRTSARASVLITHGLIVLDPRTHAVTLNGDPIPLPRREFSLLHKLLENKGRVIPRETLMQSLYGWGSDVESNALEVHIHNLRKKLGSTLIRTIRGVGYIIEEAKS